MKNACSYLLERVIGAGSAGISIGKMLLHMGFGNVIFCDIRGALYDDADWLNPAQQQMAKVTNREKKKGILADLMEGAGRTVAAAVSRAAIESGVARVRM